MKWKTKNGSASNQRTGAVAVARHHGDAGAAGGLPVEQAAAAQRAAMSSTTGQRKNTAWRAVTAKSCTMKAVSRSSGTSRTSAPAASMTMNTR